MDRMRYTLAFIQRGDEFLVLNRNNMPNMGRWNGVGGKIEPGETPEQCVLREIYEETGLSLHAVEYRGILVWEHLDDQGSAPLDRTGAHLFYAVFPDDIPYAELSITPEGILAFKKAEWLFDPANGGVASAVACILPNILRGSDRFCYELVFKNTANQLEERSLIQDIRITPCTDEQ